MVCSATKIVLALISLFVVFLTAVQQLVVTVSTDFVLQKETNNGSCDPLIGFANYSVCDAYNQYAYFLPDAMIHNTMSACQNTPIEPNANCVRYVLQEQLKTRFPSSLRDELAQWKSRLHRDNQSLLLRQLYSLFLMVNLTPVVYESHYEAYKMCCCVGAPSPQFTWHLIMLFKWDSFFIRWGINVLGSCHSRGPIAFGW